MKLDVSTPAEWVGEYQKHPLFRRVSKQRLVWAKNWFDRSTPEMRKLTFAQLSPGYMTALEREAVVGLSEEHVFELYETILIDWVARAVVL